MGKDRKYFRYDDTITSEGNYNVMHDSNVVRTYGHTKTKTVTYYV